MAIKSVLISNPLNPDYATDGADTILLQVPAEKKVRSYSDYGL